jgi:hypothetical protein
LRLKTTSSIQTWKFLKLLTNLIFQNPIILIDFSKHKQV